MLELYYLGEMAAYAARDNCFSLRFIGRELYKAEAGSSVSHQPWEAIRNR